MKDWRFGEEVKASEGNKFQSQEVLYTNERKNRKVLCLSRLTANRCELFELVACLRRVTSVGIIEASSRRGVKKKIKAYDGYLSASNGTLLRALLL